MKEIKFRGKRIDNGEWVYGYLFQVWEDAYILWGTINGIPNMIKVETKTVGQYIDLKDKNKKEIYEGDIVEYKFREDLDEIQEEVKWEKDDTGFTPFNDYCYEDKVLFGKDCEIIGNIHKNPNLLK